MTKQRVLVISLAAIIIFGLLLGGKILYQNNWLDSSVAKQSQAIAGVVSAKTVQVNGQAEMDVDTQHIGNLQQVSQKLESIAGDKPIQYFDHRIAALTTLFSQMQFSLQEGIARGNFTEMAQNLNTMAAKAGGQLQLQMDSEAIYVTLNQGSAQLIEVVERHDQGQFLPTAQAK